MTAISQASPSPNRVLGNQSDGTMTKADVTKNQTEGNEHNG
jgi:hypothetical protein